MQAPNSFENIAIGVYRNSHDTYGVIRNLSPVIDRIRSGGRDLDEKTRYCNALANTDKVKYREWKADNLPAVTFSGTFPPYQRLANKLTQHSGHATLDIDGLNPADIPYILAILAQMPQVVLAFVSPSGNGIKVIVSVTPIPANDPEHKGAWAACRDFINPLAEEFEFTVDPSGKDVSRLCFLAHDPLAIVNKNPVPIEWDSDAYLAYLKKQRKKRANASIEYEGDIDISALDFIDPDASCENPNDPDEVLEGYDVWIRVGMACHNSGVPLDVWDAWSQRGEKYRAGECERKWQTFGNNTPEKRDDDGLGKLTWATVVSIAKANGYEPPHQSLRASLTITGDAQETLGTLTDNDNALTEAFANALTDHELDTPHYHILHFEMGSGKNHSLLTSLATLKKRGIGIFENHEQVDEQVLKASLMGLSSAKLRGRGYKFDDSDLRGMDVQARRMSASVFQRNPGVMCAFYDVIEKREEKGLSPYQYCLNCPFYKEKSCPYINQFIGISENDFIATCMHDLFFDPNFRHILAGLWQTPEDSVEESIIGDVLGLEPKEASSFDIGILDEVIAKNLYLDYTYSFQDIHELADAWEGEPLADFMKRLLESLNDKTETPLEAIQTHIETLSESVQQMIASQMTQIPEDVDVHEHTQRDRNTEEVLSEAYIVENSGIRRIPVSKAAEVILREKEVPVRPYRKIAPKTKIGVSPYRGEGVSPDEVAGRLWAKGWTLLHQLQKAIQMDIEWIGTKYNIEGEQVCCDTFTIMVPPQVNHIAKRLILMGGTMDVENIITAFEGQDVDFTSTSGIPARYARGVKTYQLTDRRLTYRSVFTVETDEDGKTVFDPDTKKPLVIGLTAPAEKELEKLCTLAEKHIAEGHLKPVFISYKDFTETPISEIPLVQRMHACLQVKHFDLTRGLNFDGVKVFIVYGLPKSARPDVVKKTAEILYHTELAENPLEMTYRRSCEETDGYVAKNIGTYADKRMEAVRQQLTRDKSKQAVFRARPTRWDDTTTFHFSAEPIPDWTERATEFLRTDLQTAGRFEEMSTVIKARETAQQNGDVKALMGATGVPKSTAYRHTEKQRQQTKAEKDAELLRKAKDLLDQDYSQRATAKIIGISLGKLQSLLKQVT